MKYFFLIVNLYKNLKFIFFLLFLIYKGKITSNSLISFFIFFVFIFQIRLGFIYILINKINKKIINQIFLIYFNK